MFVSPLINKEGEFWPGECFCDILGKKQINHTKLKNMQSDTWSRLQDTVFINFLLCILKTQTFIPIIYYNFYCKKVLFFLSILVFAIILKDQSLPYNGILRNIISGKRGQMFKCKCVSWVPVCVCVYKCVQGLAQEVTHTQSYTRIVV